MPCLLPRFTYCQHDVRQALTHEEHWMLYSIVLFGDSSHVLSTDHQRRAFYNKTIWSGRSIRALELCSGHFQWAGHWLLASVVGKLSKQADHGTELTAHKLSSAVNVEPSQECFKPYSSLASCAVPKRKSSRKQQVYGTDNRWTFSTIIDWPLFKMSGYRPLCS